jgi:hypothetical protein
MKVLSLFVVAIILVSCGPKYCPTYSSYEYNKDIVKEKAYKSEDAKAKRKAKKYNTR